MELAEFCKSLRSRWEQRALEASRYRRANKIKCFMEKYEAFFADMSAFIGVLYHLFKSKQFRFDNGTSPS